MILMWPSYDPKGRKSKFAKSVIISQGWRQKDFSSI